MRFKVGDRVRIISKLAEQYYLEEGVVLAVETATYTEDNPAIQVKGEDIYALDCFPKPYPPAQYYWIAGRHLQLVDDDGKGSWDELKDIWQPKKNVVGE
jgi:hypothetical protein